jgi:ribosomal protein L35
MRRTSKRKVARILSFWLGLFRHFFFSFEPNRMLSAFLTRPSATFTSFIPQLSRTFAVKPKPAGKGKLKTHKASAKSKKKKKKKTFFSIKLPTSTQKKGFRVTGGGSVMFGGVGRRHNAQTKSPSKAQSMRKGACLEPSSLFAKNITRDLLIVGRRRGMGMHHAQRERNDRLERFIKKTKGLLDALPQQ